MRLTHVSIPSADVARSLGFYEGLGLKAIVRGLDSEGTIRYARLAFPGGDGTLSLERRPGGAPGVVVYFECDDLEARIAGLKAAGYRFTDPLETKPWHWREATLLDPDGNRLCLFHAGRYRLDPPWRLPSSVNPSRDSLAPAGPFEPGSLEPFLAVNNQGYVDVPIPAARDLQIAAYLGALAAAEAGERDRAASTLGPAYTATFLAYAERMASLSVRDGTTRDAGLGVLAVALIWRGAADVRPAIPVLGLLYDAIARTGHDPVRSFGEIRALCPADVAPVLSDFVTRADLDQIAEEMGFTASNDRCGFRYLRTWGAGRVDFEA